MLDLFSGAAGFTQAADHAGIETVAFSEIEPAACKLLASRYPETPNLGDVSKINVEEVKERFGRIDVICGGWPCQDHSVAGKRAGLAGDRSGLFWEIERLARGFRPTWLVLENVAGLMSGNKGRDFGTILNALDELGYGVAWRILDAQNFGVPQRRRRVFIVGCLGDPFAAGKVLFESEGVSGDTQESGEAGEEVAETLGGGSGARGWASDTERMTFVPEVSGALTARYFKGTDSDATETLIYQCQGTNVGEMGTLRRGNGNVTGGVPFVTHALTGEGHDASEDGTGRGTPIIPIQDASCPREKSQNGIGVGTDNDPMYTLDARGDHAVAFAQNQRGEVRISDTHPSLTSGGGKPGEGYPAVAYPLRSGRRIADSHGNQGNVVPQDMKVRRLTPIETERLMSWPDGWTDVGLSDSARYRLCGNGVVTNVVEWILRRLPQP